MPQDLVPSVRLACCLSSIGLSIRHPRYRFVVRIFLPACLYLSLGGSAPPPFGVGSHGGSRGGGGLVLFRVCFCGGGGGVVLLAGVCARGARGSRVCPFRPP